MVSERKIFEFILRNVPVYGLLPLVLWHLEGRVMVEIIARNLRDRFTYNAP